ncbi:MAG: hypothetical protein ACOX5Z_04810 [Desulfobulbus sp.]|jgi:hypothetical protein
MNSHKKPLPSASSLVIKASSKISGPAVVSAADLSASVCPLTASATAVSDHGKWGFGAFSHHKSLLHRVPRPDLPGRYPPYSKKTAKNVAGKIFL